MIHDRTFTEARAAAMQALHDEHVYWHDHSSCHPGTKNCDGRHGVVFGLAPEEIGPVAQMLVYYYGDRCWWRKANDEGTYDLEFVHMAKVTPPPTKPWEWCGETVLYEEEKSRWDAHTRAIATARARFQPGDEVTFTDRRGNPKKGWVARVNDKTVSVTVPGEGGWRVSPRLLTPVQKGK